MHRRSGCIWTSGAAARPAWRRPRDVATDRAAFFGRKFSYQQQPPPPSMLLALLAEIKTRRNVGRVELRCEKKSTQYGGTVHKLVTGKLVQPRVSIREMQGVGAVHAFSWRAQYTDPWG